MVTAEGGESLRYIGDADGSSFQVSPDGKYLSFLRTVEKDRQLFLMPTSGGEASRYTSHPGGIGAYQWSRDEKKIFFSAEETGAKKSRKSMI